MSQYYENCYSAFSALSEIHSTFPDKPLGRAPIYRWLRKLFDDATSKPLQRHIGLEFADAMVKIVGQNPYCTSNYFAVVLNCCTATVMGRWKEFGSKETWSAWISLKRISAMIILI